MKVQEILSTEHTLLKKSIARLQHPIEGVKLAMGARAEHRMPKRTRQPAHIKISSTSNGSE